MNYYKATRPDGTDFYSGTINYARALETGEVIRHPAKPVRNDPSTYLSVSIAPADCTGMQWPCRLFRVEPIGRTLRATHIPNKRACRALRVVEELPAWQALGPNGEAVAAFIGQARSLTETQIEQLYTAWHAARAARAAREAARAAARAARAAREAARDAAGDAARAARDAAGDAACALVVRDLISEEHFNAVYGPWASVMEKPE